MEINRHKATGRRKYATLVFSTIVLSGLTFLTLASEQNTVTNESHSENSVSSYLESDSSASIFVKVLVDSVLWNELKESENLTLLLPTDDSLRQAGSAFLLEVVLPKVENKQRLDNLIATHIVTEKLELNADKSDSITVYNDNCFKIETDNGVTQIGPEAVVTKKVIASNGNIYFIDHMLWVPYDDEKTCF